MLEFIQNGRYCFSILVTQRHLVVVLVVVDTADGDVFRVEVEG